MQTIIPVVVSLMLSLSGSQDAEPGSDVDSKPNPSRTEAQSQAELPRGRGRGPGFGRGRGMAGMQGDMATLHTLFADRSKIQRTVKLLPDGAEATTESDDKKVAALIQEHVPAMEQRVTGNTPLPPMTFHPIFVNLIKHADDYELSYETTDKGIKVTYKAEDPFVIMLVQEHAQLVSRFITNGMEEIHKPYKFPENAAVAIAPVKAIEREELAFTYPRIEGLGKVVQLTSAEQQPRHGSKIVVDLITGGEPDKLNAGIEKVARFVNIYAGAGAKPADVAIAVVLHGDATLIGLKSEIYAERFKCDGNPHLECIQKLTDAGVTIYVCGQSLVGKGQHPHDVDPHVKVAVSALTALVNLQGDGHAYVPLGK